MVFKKKIDSTTRAAVLHLRNNTKLSLKEIGRQCKVSPATVFRFTNKSKNAERMQKPSCGRRRIISKEQETLLVRSIGALREREGTFSSRRLMEHTGVRNASDRTIRRVLKRNGYFYLQARKKGLMHKTDKEKRVEFARNMQINYSQHVWTNELAFYLDGVSFIYKTNPMDQARAPKVRVWRKKSEGLKQGCLAKGSKVGTGGKVIKMIVAISHSKGVVICEQYEKMNAAYFTSFIDEHFNSMFDRAAKGTSRLWLQDGDPSQNSATARAAMHRTNATLLKIPPRSPDLNPIENIFHIVSNKLRKDALRHCITRESYKEFRDRVRRTITEIPVELIDKTIESMNGRITEIIRNGGERLKY